MNIPKMDVFLQKDDEGLDFGVSLCYNSFRIIFGGTNNMSKTNNQLQTRNSAISEKSVNDILKNCTDIVKEVGLTKRDAQDKYAEIIMSPNVSDEIKEEVIKTNDKKQICNTVIIVTGLVLASALTAYGIKIHNGTAA